MLCAQRCFTTVSPFKICANFSTKIRPAQKGRVPKGRAPRKHGMTAGVNFGPNPGVQRQMTAMELSEKEIMDPNLLDDMEKQFWDADKMYDLYDRENQIDTERQSLHQVRRKQFKDEKSPNMLTWDEKQEIKTLHAKDPEKWSVMKLAYSYPASPSIIQKVLRAKWKLTTSEDIFKHDSRVKRNWEALAEGQLHVPDEHLLKHLKTFTNRSKLSPESKEVINNIKSEDRNDVSAILQDGGVFSNIYKSYKDLSQAQTEENKNQEANTESYIEKGLAKLKKPPLNDTFIVPQNVGNVKLRTLESMTLTAMRGKIKIDPPTKEETLSTGGKDFVQSHSQSSCNSHEDVYQPLKDPIGAVPHVENYESNVCERVRESREEYSSSNNGSIHSDKAHLYQQSSNLENLSSNVSCKKSRSDFSPPELSNTPEIPQYIDKEDQELKASIRTARAARSKAELEALTKAVKEYASHSSDSYPLEIEIPKDLWKKGALYRVKDRFYADDGEFLYRVPGLIKD